MDTLKLKRKKEDSERTLDFFFPRCTKRRPRNECPLNDIELCYVCKENHAIDKLSSLPSLEIVYQGSEIGLEKILFIKQRRPQGPWPYQQVMQGARYPSFSLDILHITHLGTCHILCPIVLSILLYLSIHPYNHIKLNLLNGETLLKDGGLIVQPPALMPPPPLQP